MANLFDEYGGYNYRSFTGALGKWTIIETVSAGTLKTTLDTFKSDTGEMKEFKRKQVMEQYGLGNIKPVEDSRILFRNISKEETKRIQARRTDV